jgi:hypothetical protein
MPAAALICGASSCASSSTTCSGPPPHFWNSVCANFTMKALRSRPDRCFTDSTMDARCSHSTSAISAPSPALSGRSAFRPPKT